MTPSSAWPPYRLTQPLWLVAYDVRSPKRWRRLYRLLCGHGWRIQYSAFLLALDDAKIEFLTQEIRHCIDEHKDDVRLYHLPTGTRVWHDGPTPPDGVLWDIAGLEGLC
ncbi:CRISPR-associated endonuclease Cas2 [Acidithiobacillus caldus]